MVSQSFRLPSTPTLILKTQRRVLERDFAATVMAVHISHGLVRIFKWSSADIELPACVNLFAWHDRMHFVSMARTHTHAPRQQMFHRSFLDCSFTSKQGM